MKHKYSETIPALHPFVKKELKRLTNSRKCAQALAKRAKIILLAEQGLRNLEIASKIGMDRKNVGVWRRRFQENQGKINKLAEMSEQKACSELIVTTLSDQKRPGRPKKFSYEDHDSVTAIACSNPESYKWPLSSWSVRSLTEFLIEKSFLSDIAKSTVHRILKQNRLRPHKIQHWIHPPEKSHDPIAFAHKARECSRILKNVQSLYENGIQVISIDEKPGIRLFKPIREDLPPVSGKSDRKREMFYERIGRVDLIQAQNVAMGDLFQPYINFYHKEEDFVCALKACLEAQLQETPDDEIIIICDNFNTHVSEGVVRLIANFLNINEKKLGIKRKYGILKDKVTRSEFLMDPEHKIRFMFTPKHASWLNPVEVYFSIIHRKLLKNFKAESIEKTKETIIEFTNWFNTHSANPYEYRFSGFDRKLRELELLYQNTPSPSLPPKPQS